VGITESTRNLDRSVQSSSTDIFAQGAANVVAGFFSSIPVSASVGQTALNRATGARTRWTNIFCSLWLLAFIFLLAGVIEMVPMAVLAGIMVYAGIGAMAFRRAKSIFRTGWSPAVAFFATLAIAALISVPAAVMMGLVLSLVMNMVQSSQTLTIREVTVGEGGALIEGTPPSHLPAHQITLVNLYGDLFFAAAKRMQQELPKIGSGVRPVLIIRFRGQHNIGATLVDVLTEYARHLAQVGGRLYLAGVERDALRQFERAGRIPLDDVVYLVPATERMGEATQAALTHAHRWLAENKDYSGSSSGVYNIRAVHLIEPGDADPHFTGPIEIVASETLKHQHGSESEPTQGTNGQVDDAAE
jgi:SulP family sulfate permease